MTEPLYVIVAQRPGAPMATGDLKVETVTFSEATRLQVHRPPQHAVAHTDPDAAVE